MQFQNVLTRLRKTFQLETKNKEVKDHPKSYKHS